MKQQTIQKSNESESSTFLEYHDDSLYKNCFTCGQNLYPFKHGICRLCGENNWIIQFEKKPQTEKLGIQELMDN